jgi:hypothetical protein
MVYYGVKKKYYGVLWCKKDVLWCKMVSSLHRKV